MFLRILFSCALATIPFSAFAGIGAFGEMARELSTYFFIPAIMVAFLKVLGKNGRSYLMGASTLTKCVGLIFTCVAISFLANAYDIFNNEFRGRSGLEKYFSSLLVLFYGFGVAFLTFIVTKEKWKDIVIKPIALSAVFCVVFSIIEILGHKLHVMVGFYTFVDSLVHFTGDSSVSSHDPAVKAWAEGWDPRLRSLAFEPPAFGNYSGFAWPWVYLGYISSTGTVRFRYGLILTLFTALIVIAEARTGWVMMGANLSLIFLMKYIYLPKKPPAHYRSTVTIFTCIFALLAAGSVGAYLALYDHLVAEAISTHYVSNISRMSSIESAFNMFLDAPMFGFGFGQFGFFTGKYMPYWGFFSYELLPKLVYPNEPWPAVYSVYARWAAELGLMGLLMWPGLWLWTAAHTITSTLHVQMKTGEQPIIAYGIVMCSIAVLTSGIATDTLRTPMIWVTLGLAGRYFYECRKALLVIPPKVVPPSVVQSSPTLQTAPN